MDIAQMHVWFRQYAQQMGMQNVRAILPEQIDMLINTSITDAVNQLIAENIGVTNDRVITDNSKIGQINALRTLYKVKVIDLHPKFGLGNPPKEYFRLITPRIGKYSTNFIRSEDDNANHFEDAVFPDYMFLVDFAISYIQADQSDPRRPNGIILSKDSYYSPIVKSGSETNFFPVRLIDDAYLADTLNDFVLKPRLRSPILVNYSYDYTEDGVEKTKSVFDLYIDKFEKVVNTNFYTLRNNLIPHEFRMSYIAKPAKVQYSEDINGVNVDCDLPEYMHVDILKHAVDLYRIAISGSLHATQQQMQNQQSEAMRNAYRNDGRQQAQVAQPQQ